MTQIEVLAIAAPILGGLVVMLTVVIANHFDDREAEAERKARLPSRNETRSEIASAAE